MKKTLFMLMLVTIAACQEDSVISPSFDKNTLVVASATMVDPVPDFECSFGATWTIVYNNSLIGAAALSLDAKNVYFKFYFTQEGWFILSDSVWLGDCSVIPSIQDFTRHETFTPSDQVQSLNFSIPFGNTASLGCGVMKATFARYVPGTYDLEILNWERSIAYLKCPPPDDKSLRTVAHGEWAAPPHGGNTATYLHSHFASAFPYGLTLGCNYTINLQSAEAVSAFLPQGGQPNSLTQNFTDPVRNREGDNHLWNSLAGHAVALKLSIGFDSWDPDFAETATHLETAEIASGLFQGWTVGNALAEAERVLGGCPSPHSARELNDLLEQINESCKDGVNNGFLVNN